MKFLIVGLGSIGRRQLSILRHLGETDLYCLRSGASETATPEGVNEIDSIANAGQNGIDAALITNPTSFHVSAAAELARQGIPLFIEKPLGKDLSGVDDLQRLCDQMKVPVLMGYNFLHHPAIRFIKELIDDGKAGKVISARAQFGTYMPRWHKGEDHTKSYAAVKGLGGGVVLTSIHEQNYLSSFFGAVTDVKAMETTGNTTGIECEEGVEMIMKHESGVISSVHLNFFQRPYYRDCQIIGTQGTIYWNFIQPEVKLMQSEHTEIWKLGRGAYELLDESYTNQMKHFIQVVRGEESPVCGLADGVRDLRTALKILNEIGRK
jgi:predicted dehydrogenase